MKHILLALAFAGAVAIGAGAVAPAIAAGAAGISGTASSVLDQRASSELVQTVDHRGWRHRDRDRWRGRHYGPRYRHYDRGPSFSLYFGSPGYYYEPRYRVAPAPRYRHRASNAHVRWCESRYRSYDAWSNTWQPYNGPRRQCFSPYS